MLKKLSLCLLIALCLMPLMAQNQQAANELRFSLSGISEITISYDEENITFFESEDDRLVIKENMTENKSRYFAKVREQNGSIHISEGNKPSIGRFTRSVEVYLPKSYNQNLTVTSTSGIIDFTHINLNLHNFRVENTSSSIVIADVTAAEIYLSSTSGNIRCSKLNGNVTYESANGNLDVMSAMGSGDYSTSSSGTINVTYTEVRGDISFYNGNDDITLGLPNDLDFIFSAATKNGSINTNFQQSLLLDERKLSGAVGNHPAVTVSLESNNGNIEVSRK